MMRISRDDMNLSEFDEASVGCFYSNKAYNYDSWGKLISIEGSLKDSIGVKNPYRYRGYRYDNETGMYYLQSRYYDPEWGRFINADALIGQTGDLLGHNLFMYCKNNPVLLKDENGFRPMIGSSWNEEMQIERGYSVPISDTSPIGNIRVPSSPSLVSRAADISTGVFAEITRTPGYMGSRTGTLGRGPIQVAVIPSAARETVKPFASIATKVSYGTTAILGIWDIAHIWTADNGLTREQRGLRTVLKVGAIGAGMLAGMAIAPIFAAGAAASGLTALALMGAGAVASYAAGSFIDYEEAKISRRLGLR